jgi:hypothetical protein
MGGSNRNSSSGKNKVALCFHGCRVRARRVVSMVGVDPTKFGMRMKIMSCQFDKDLGAYPKRLRLGTDVRSPTCVNARPSSETNKRKRVV